MKIRDYYYCDVNCFVYTEAELIKSKIDVSRFKFIGKFFSRADAEDYVENDADGWKCPVLWPENGKRY